MNPMTPINGTITAVIIHPAKVYKNIPCVLNPAARGNTKFPEPKNIENMAKPAVRIIRKDDIKVFSLFLRYTYKDF
jgi:hypothetical protein